MTAAATSCARAETLTTARLVLEPLRPDHAGELAPVLADPALHAFTGGEPADEADLRARFARQAAGHSPDGAQGWLNWVARDRVTQAPVGTIQATVSSSEGRWWRVRDARRCPQGRRSSALGARLQHVLLPASGGGPDRHG